MVPLGFIHSKYSTLQKYLPHQISYSLLKINLKKSNYDK